MLGFDYKTHAQRAAEIPEHIKYAFHEDMLLAKRNGMPLLDDAAYIAEIEASDWYPVALLAYSFEYSRRKYQDERLRAMRLAMRDLGLID